MITIHDVARESGVSPATVSRVLSGKKTRDKNKDKVLKAANDLRYHGYSYSTAPYQTDAKSESNDYQKKNTIFVISSNSIVRSIDGIFSAAHSIGYRVC